MPFWKKKKWDEQVDESYGDYYRDGPSRPRVSFIPHLLGMFFTSGLFLAGVGLVGGRTLLEKTLTSLASPCGLIWLTLLVLVYFAFLHKNRGAAFLGLISWLLLTIAGNSYIANEMMNSLERPYINVDPLEMEPFDTVFLLGGGTGTKMDGNSQVNGNGDRVVTCARMYHAGKITNIICTGSQPLRSDEKDMHPSEEAREVLADLDIPESAITMMHGANTSQENAERSKVARCH